MASDRRPAPKTFFACVEASARDPELVQRFHDTFAHRHHDLSASIARNGGATTITGKTRRRDKEALQEFSRFVWHTVWRQLLAARDADRSRAAAPTAGPHRRTLPHPPQQEHRWTPS